MKYVKLLTSVRAGGVLRHPYEGVLHLEDDEAGRLIEAQSAEDVTSDFPAEDTTAAEKLLAEPEKAPDAKSEPSQTQVYPNDAPAAKAAKIKE